MRRSEPVSRAQRREHGAEVVALAGGVGAARFLRGLVDVVDPEFLTVVVNTADDVERHGLWVSPDIDSVVYGLADVRDEDRGWGRRDETWNCLAELAVLGEDTWFALGDRDLATHIWRTARRRRGERLSAITAAQCRALGIRCRVVPMTDAVVTTRITTAEYGELHVQEWFVRHRCQPPILDVRYAGIEKAAAAPGVFEALERCAAVVICPSNPVMSIAPILAVPGVRQAVRAAPRVVAVSPIVEGRALKGPAAEMLVHLGLEASPVGVAAFYAGVCDTIVLDRRDGDLVSAIEELGMRAVVTETIMSDRAAAVDLARAVCAAAGIEPTAVAA